MGSHVAIDNTDKFDPETPRTRDAVRQDIARVSRKPHNDRVTAARLEDPLLKRCGNVAENSHLSLQQRMAFRVNGAEGVTCSIIDDFRDMAHDGGQFRKCFVLIRMFDFHRIAVRYIGKGRSRGGHLSTIEGVARSRLEKYVTAYLAYHFSGIKLGKAISTRSAKWRSPVTVLVVARFLFMYLQTCMITRLAE